MRAGDDTQPLEAIVGGLLDEATQQGADAAEAAVTSDRGLAVTARLGDVETVEFTRDHQLGVTVYVDGCKGSASTTDLGATAVRETVEAACRIARYASRDECAGLADPQRLAREIPDLDLYHPWGPEIDEAIGIAVRCETAARDHDPRISNSEGSTLATQSGSFVYGNTHGFLAGYPTSRHSLSCSVIAGEQADMQRDYWYTNGRAQEDLLPAEQVGRTAAERAVARLGARKLDTRKAPVLFRADIAVSLLGSFAAAIRGGAIYRKSSFLLERLGSGIFPGWVRIHESPHKLRGLGSAPFDNEGVATQARDLVRDGILQGWLLDSYAARKLGLETTGNAGGARNLTIEASPAGAGFEDLIRQMGTGLVVTELMGHGTNMVTGDYSRGAAGYWVENGEPVTAVEEITVAGNLVDMYENLQEVGTDNNIPGSTKTGSWLVDGMTIAGD